MNDRGAAPREKAREAVGPRGRGVRFVWSELAPGRRIRLSALVVASFIGGLIEAASLLLLARVALALVNGDKPVSASLGPLLSFDASVGLLIGLTAALIVVRFVIQIFTVHIQASLFGEVIEETRTRMLHGYLRASWSLQSGERDGRLQELVGGFASQVAGQMNSLINLLVAVFTVIAMLAAALLANVLATLAVAAAVLILVAVLRPFRDAVKRRSKESARTSVELSTAVNEIASMAQEVHVFGVERSVEGHLDELTRRSRRAAQRLQMLSGTVPAVYRAAALLIVVGGVGMVYAIGGTRLASLGAVILIGIRSISYGQGVQSSIQALHTGIPYIDAVYEERARYEDAEVGKGTRSLARIDHLEFDQVAYSYDNTRFALNGVSFEAVRGRIVGIVGPSGAGKSTLVQLMLRLREPDAGRIVVDGVDAREFLVEDWAARVVFVPQDAHLFSGTLADNIRFFRDVPLESLQQAARRAHLHDEVVQWPEGYETAVGERGRKLSGGQRQRLTIARALVGDPDVVVLDEPTSNLDVHSEAAIRATLVELSEQAMVFVIAHRLSTLDMCDRIMVIQDGELRGFDEPKRLEQSSGFYREALRLSGLR